MVRVASYAEKARTAPPTAPLLKIEHESMQPYSRAKLDELTSHAARLLPDF